MWASTSCWLALEEASVETLPNCRYRTDTEVSEMSRSSVETTREDIPFMLPIRLFHFNAFRLSAAVGLVNCLDLTCSQGAVVYYQLINQTVPIFRCAPLADVNGRVGAR